MNATVIDNLRDRLMQRYRATPIPRFLSWWGGELASLVPAKFRQRLMPPKPQLWIVPAETGGGDMRIWRVDHGRPRVLDVFGAGEDLQILRTRWRDLVAEFDDGNPEVRLCLHESQFLAMPIELPAAVEENLDAAVRFQLDQLTPFSADQVELGVRVENQDVEHRRIAVGLRIVPRETLAPMLERARAFGAPVHVVDTLAADDPPEVEGFNLLPEDRRPHYVHARARYNTLLGVGLVVVLALVMTQTLMLRERTVSGLEREADRLRGEAMQVMQLQTQLEDSLAAANFLAEARAARPTVVEVLDELTVRLPADIWLQQFQLQGDELRINGQAEGSQRVVNLLNQSPMFVSPEITGPISIDPRTGQERFRSQVRITVPEPAVPEDDPAPADGERS
ncbi:MAG: PilN domain-containing protein [Wenzhouxiangellaceae bacterium]